MSRSYKKTPIIKDGSQIHRKQMKKLANKKVRRAVNVPSGKQYRKFSNSWDIYDYVSRSDLSEYIHNWENSKHRFYYYPTVSEVIIDWKRNFYYK